LFAGSFLEEGEVEGKCI